MRPLVTVVIPTIGRPKYIVDTVRSVLAQDYQNLQVLISDNAPTVATADLLSDAGISDERIQIVVRPRRLGFSEHMNACLQDARGAHVMILSDDDQISHGYVAEMLELMRSNPRVTVCLGRQQRISEADEGLLEMTESPRPAQVLPGPEYLRDTLSQRLETGVLTNISLFAKRADVLRAGGFRLYPDGSHADNFLLFSLALSGEVALGRSLMLYRVYLNSFGLGTPFSALHEATRRYTDDAARVLAAQQQIDASLRQDIMRWLRWNNMRLLLSRIRNVYMRREPAIRSARHLLKVAAFRLQRLPR